MQTLGLNDFSISCDMGNESVVIAENITQEQAFHLLQESEDYFLEVYVDGHWEVV